LPFCFAESNPERWLPALHRDCASYSIQRERDIGDYPRNFQLADLHEVECQEKSARYLGALWRARISIDQDPPLRISASRLVVPALVQNRTSICSLRLRRVRTED